MQNDEFKFAFSTPQNRISVTVLSANREVADKMVLCQPEPSAIVAFDLDLIVDIES